VHRKETRPLRGWIGRQRRDLYGLKRGGGVFRTSPYFRGGTFHYRHYESPERDKTSTSGKLDKATLYGGKRPCSGSPERGRRRGSGEPPGLKRPTGK